MQWFTLLIVQSMHNLKKKRCDTNLQVIISSGWLKLKQCFQKTL